MQHRETLNDTVWQLGQNGGEARAVVDKLRELSGILARHGIRLCPILEERGEEVGLVPESPGLEGWLNDPQTPRVPLCGWRGRARPGGPLKSTGETAERALQLVFGDGTNRVDCLFLSGWNDALSLEPEGAPEGAARL